MVWLSLQIIDLVFHPIAFALDEHGFGVMQESVEQRRGKYAVVVEDFRPVFEGAIGGDDGGTALIAGTDDLEEAIGTEFVDGKVAEFIDDQELRLEVFVHFPLDAA